MEQSLKVYDRRFHKQHRPGCELPVLTIWKPSGKKALLAVLHHHWLLPQPRCSRQLWQCHPLGDSYRGQWDLKALEEWWPPRRTPGEWGIRACCGQWWWASGWEGQKQVHLLGCWHRITGSLGSEKASKITESGHCCALGVTSAAVWSQPWGQPLS